MIMMATWMRVPHQIIGCDFEARRCQTVCNSKVSFFKKYVCFQEHWRVWHNRVLLICWCRESFQGMQRRMKRMHRCPGLVATVSWLNYEFSKQAPQSHIQWVLTRVEITHVTLTQRCVNWRSLCVRSNQRWSTHTHGSDETTKGANCRDRIKKELLSVVF